ncbi:MAG: TIR domain-containing protein [Proteobacteria bacterium]|nr:TIR domain-containing protein [Pseudomonadota bacterium]
MSEPVNSIFLSYASQDAAAAARIGEGLRAARLEVWFDQSELRGGDAWDQLIRRRIRECRLFVPVISAHTQSRLEGYFRLEWRLAVERSHLMADGKAFIVPVTIDAIDERHAEVPEAFRAFQWTPLPGGVPTPAFISRVTQLLTAAPAGAAATAATGAASHAGVVPAARAAPHTPRWVPVLGAALAALAIAAFVFLRGHGTPPASAPAPQPPASAPAAAAAATAPAHSVAVLPFTNMSGDPHDEYFSDGLSEELLNTLAAVPGLKVAARTSSFSFKGKNEEVSEIARKLNVATVLEGSVRRDKSHVRISTELIDAGTGFQRWSQTYDRDLKDVLALQSEIAGSVAGALKVKLLQSDAGGDVGGTDNPKAFDAYLRAEELARRPAISAQVGEETLRAYDAALAVDPNYANAYRGRAEARINYAFNSDLTPAEVGQLTDLGIADARKAAELAPNLGAAHSVIGNGLAGQQDYAGALAEFRKAMALSPGDARVYSRASGFFVGMGDTEGAIALARHATELDPLNPHAYESLQYVYYYAHRYPESLAAAQRSLELGPNLTRSLGWIGFANIELGNYEAAREACASEKMQWVSLTCLAVVYDRLGRHADAEAALHQLIQRYGDAASYQQAEIYAAWGDAPHALEALQRAQRTRDPGMQGIKADPLFARIKDDPGLKSLIEKLNFPNVSATPHL